MSDLTPGLPDVPNEPIEQRPFVVAFLAVLIFIAAFVQLIAVVIAITLMFRPGEAQQLFGQPVSDWYWLMTAALTLVLALIYIWMGRGLLTGNPQAWMLLNILAIINIFFSVFQIAFGTGWAALVINFLILALNNTRAVREWFRVYG